MEDKLKIIHSAKDEVQQMNSQQACVISELQTKNNSMSMNVDNLKRQIETLQQVAIAIYFIAIFIWKTLETFLHIIIYVFLYCNGMWTNNAWHFSWQGDRDFDHFNS